MTKISQNINNNEHLKLTNPSFKTAPAMQAPLEQYQEQVQIPDIYYSSGAPKEPQTFVDKIKKVDIMGMIYPWFETPLLMGGTCLALSKGIDLYTEACGGEYEKSILGKATRMGDRLENSSFVKSKPVQAVLNFFKGIGEKTSKLFKRSNLITAMKETPARPEKMMAKSEMITQEVRILEEFNKITETLGLASEETPKLSQLALDKDEKALVKQLKKSLGDGFKEEVIADTIQLRRIGITDEAKIAEIISNGTAKEEILKAMGLTAEDLAKIKVEPEKYIEKVKEASKKVGNKVRISAGRIGALGPAQITERTVSLDQVGNKLKSMKLGEGAQTKTGRFFAKVLHKIHRGFTFGGGKIGMFLFIAPSFVQMMKNTKKADPDQKIGTIANGSIEAISWVFTFPLAIASTYAIGGMKHAGLSKTNVDLIHSLTQDFNKKVDAGLLKDKTKYDKAYKTLMKQREALSKVKKPQNLFAKIMKKITNVFYCDLNTVRSYKGENVIMNKVRQIPNFLRHVTCEPVRFILAMFVIESFLRNLITKGTKAVFGNHYDHFKEEEHEAKKKEQKTFTHNDLQKRLYETQAKKVAPKEEVTKPVEKKHPEPVILPIGRPKTETNQNTVVQNNDSTNIEENTDTAIPPVQNETIKEKAVAMALPEENKTLEILQPETVTDTKVPQTTNNTTPLQQEVSPEIQKTSQEPKYIPNQNSTINKQISDEKVDNYTYIPSSENVIKQKQKEKDEFNVNKYIPAQTAENFTKTFDNSALEAALRRADRAEQRAIETLAGNFGNM